MQTRRTGRGHFESRRRLPAVQRIRSRSPPPSSPARFDETTPESRARDPSDVLRMRRSVVRARIRTRVARVCVGEDRVIGLGQVIIPRIVPVRQTPLSSRVGPRRRHVVLSRSRPSPRSSWNRHRRRRTPPRVTCRAEIRPEIYRLVRRGLIVSRAPRARDRARRRRCCVVTLEVNARSRRVLHLARYTSASPRVRHGLNVR